MLVFVTALGFVQQIWEFRQILFYAARTFKNSEWFAYACTCCVDGGGLVAKSCPTLGTPMGCIALQASLPMGFPRQESWSG